MVETKESHSAVQMACAMAALTAASEAASMAAKKADEMVGVRALRLGSLKAA